MLSWNHYETAFEAFLRERTIPFVAVEERHRNRLADGSSLKNLDFVISCPTGSSWLIDVKGRKFPGGTGRSAYWKHWATKDDMTGLLKWEQHFGGRFCGLLLFAYLICGDMSPLPEEDLFCFKNRLYGFIGISIHDYVKEVRLLSPKWQTYSMPLHRFRKLARPFTELLEKG
ncbi:MAG: HYExAFE family protein [Thermoguttaceae bacterium]